ncbi:MAG: YbgC/FadM family acyl-CoA thioesterase [Alphaproteobacteria bacterium GM202ARS2]|nr:YbgC/FadM family acyl-CoA thioesterase [Alphaproteobacteria bacterium GM202ARS2]
MMKPLDSGVITGGVHHFPLRVYYEDTDAGGIVYYARYLYFAERARSEFLRALDTDGHDMHGLMAQESCAFVVRRVTATYHQPARLHDALVMVTRVCQLGRASLVMEQNLYRQDTPLFTSEVRLACVSIGDRGGRAGKVVAIPHALWQAMVAMVHKEGQKEKVIT